MKEYAKWIIYEKMVRRIKDTIPPRNESNGTTAFLSWVMVILEF